MSTARPSCCTRVTPNVPITTNLMEYFPGLDYHYLQKELDFVCWDSYPTGAAPTAASRRPFAMTAFDHALIRGCKRDVPFFTMESTPSLVNWHEYNKLKRPGVNRLQGLQTVACGGDGVQLLPVAQRAAAAPSSGTAR